MKKFSQAVDRFCLRHPRFGIPNLMLYVVIGNAVVWLFTFLDTSGLLYSNLTLVPSMVLRGQIWRLFTFALIPESSGLWVLLFLYFYYFIGTTLERQWGIGRFTLYFFSGILLTVVYSLAAYLLFGADSVVSAHYVYMSMFFSFASLYPEQRVLLFFFIPVKIKWLAYLDGAFFLYGIFQYLAYGAYAMAVLPVIAVLNFLLFCGQEFLPLRHCTRAQRQRSTEFRRRVDHIHAQERTREFRFKCAVCGRTDVSDPELEFRYCSRCQGYHCFCQDHINHHVHFTE